MTKPLEGVYELLLTHQGISGSKEGTGNDPSFGRRTISINQLQTRSRNPKGKEQGTSEERESSQKQSRKGERKSPLAQTLPTGVQDYKIGAFIHGQCVQYGQNSYGSHILEKKEDEQELSTQIMDEMRYIQPIIDVKLNNFDKQLMKLTSNVNDLRNDERIITEWQRVTNARLESVSNKCERVESIYEVKNDELDNLSIKNINDQLTKLEQNVLAIALKRSRFATCLERSDNGRQKLKEEMMAQVNQIHKNYGPDSHMPRHSRPLAEGKRSVKESLTTF
ncbi:hypothetical protein O181_094366 [Austropuccinia psidii MF-1]|uniref:Uncharacterized protein n=1 Tax=Austropuccinia psidii MF-1 TaxID=1389203 RepID=A0A9Q3J342_9BASI|nr:hypothetical protein [Austropuccinia psidii MF-1]